MTLYLNPQAESFIPSIDINNSINEIDVSIEQIDNMFNWFNWINDDSYWSKTDQLLIDKSIFKQKYNIVMNELKHNIRQENIKKIKNKNNIKIMVKKINTIIEEIKNIN